MPDSGLGVQVKGRQTFSVVPSSLGSGPIPTCAWNPTRTSLCDEDSGSMKIATRLDHVSLCQTGSGTNWPNRWTYREFVVNALRD